MIKRVGATAAPMELYKIKLRTYLIISEDNNNKRKYIKYMSSEFIPIGQSAMRTGSGFPIRILRISYTGNPLKMSIS